MKKVLLLMAIAICFGAISAMGKGMLEKNFLVTPFNDLQVKSSVKVYYEQGAKHSCTITATAKDMKKIKVEVKGKKLLIYTLTSEKKIEGVRFNIAKNISDEVIVRISSPELKSVTCVGSAEFIATNNIRSENISFKVTGSGEIKTKKIIANSLFLSISGSGEASVLEADVDDVTATIYGSGDLDMEKVSSRCQKAALSIHGSGEMDVQFSDCKDLKCSISGSGAMELKGKVLNFTSNIFGSGEIKRNELQISGNCIENNMRSKNSSGAKTVNNINPKP